MVDRPSCAAAGAPTGTATLHKRRRGPQRSLTGPGEGPIIPPARGRRQNAGPARFPEEGMSPRSTARRTRGRATPAAAPALAAILAAGVAVMAAAALAFARSAGAQQPPAGAPQPSAGAQQPISVAVPPTPPPLQTGPVPDLDLISSAQVAGWVEPCG